MAILVGVIGVLAAAVLYQSGEPACGWVLCALTGLLASPISWDHHWVWMVPVLVVCVDAAVRAGRARRWVFWTAACAVVAVFYDWPGKVHGNGPLVPRGLLPLVYGPGEHPYAEVYHWHGAEVLLGNAYVLGGLVVFAAMIAAAVLARPGRIVQPAGRWLDDSFQVAQRTAADPDLIRG
jgi:alpha-1,2-mannosyltransferase